MPELNEHYFDWQLSGQALRELGQRWPKLDVDALVSAAGLFRIQMEIWERNETTRWFEEVRRLEMASRAFLAELEAVKLARFSFHSQFLGRRPDWLIVLLIRLTRVLQKASAQFLETGRETDRRSASGPRADFILTLGRQLKHHGYGVSARANDDLVRVLDLVLAEAGYPVKDTRKTVAHVLKRAGNSWY